MTIAGVAQLGTGFTGGTSSASYNMTSSQGMDPAAGQFAILIHSSYNLSASDGATNNHTSVTSASGTWTKLQEYTNANAAAGSGVTTSVWLFEPTSKTTAGFTITLNLSAATTDATASGYIFSHDVGKKVRVDPTSTTIASQLDAAANYSSQAFSGLPNKHRLWFRGLGKRINELVTVTPSSGFTAITGRRSQAAASAREVGGEFMISTATGATSAPTGSAAGDTAELFFAMDEYATSRIKPRSSYLY